jgi:hypothetical protein
MPATIRRHGWYPQAGAQWRAARGRRAALSHEYALLSGHPAIVYQLAIAESRLGHADSPTVLDANWPGLGDPTHGVIVGADFYYIANSGWNRWRDDGSRVAGAAATPPIIMRTSLLLIGTVLRRRSMPLLPRYASLIPALLLTQASQPGPTQRIPQFENDQVKVWKSIVMPNAPLAMHRHEHPRVIIALAGGTMKIVEQSGATESHQWETGKAYWLPANAPGTLHSDVNAGDKPIEVMVVELKTAQ